MIKCYNFRMFYVIIMVTTKEASIDYIQKKVWREPKHATRKIQQDTKEEVREERRDGKSCKTYRKIIVLNGSSKSFLISKAESVYRLWETCIVSKDTNELKLKG